MLGLHRISRLVTAVTLCVISTHSFAALPGEFQGWLWESGVVGGNLLDEEYCFAQTDITIAADLNWTSSLAQEVCWGRNTDNTGRSFTNPPPFATTPSEADQSTQALVSAGGNMWEIFGEEFEQGIGQGEERFAVLLSTPSDDNLLMVGGYDSDSEGATEEFRFVDLFVRSTTATQNARTAANLAGTSWRIGIYEHGLDDTDVNTEYAASSVLSLDLQASGVCSYSVSSVFPDFVDNADLYTATQFDDGAAFDDRFVGGGLFSQNNSSCSYTIDADKYLAVTKTLTPSGESPTVETIRYVVSDDNRFLIRAPSAVLEDNARSLDIGYRVANQMSTSAIDGTYFFYLIMNEFGADGAGAAAAGFGPRDWQEFDLMGRGQVSFDSTTVGVTPTGESGTWYACDMELVSGDVEHEWTGSAGSNSVALGEFSTEIDNIVFDDCDFQLDSDGGLKLYVNLTDPEDPGGGLEALLRGYVNDNGELMSLTHNEVGPGVGDDRDLADVKFLLGMKYSGDPDGDEDADGITNLQEFELPLPPGAPTLAACTSLPLPIVCPLPDVNSNGYADLVVVRDASILAEVRDGQSGTLLKNITFFGNAFTPVAAATLSDADGDGMAELAILATRNSDGRIAVEMRNVTGLEAPRQVYFALNHSPVDMAVVEGDADGNGIPEIAVLSSRNSDGRGLVEVKNAFGATSPRALWAGAGLASSDLEVVPDADGNGVPEVAILSTRNSDGRIVAEIKNAAGATLPNAVWFAPGHTAIDLTVVPDKDNNGIPEVATLSSRNSDGRIVVEIKNASGPTAPSAVWFSAGHTAIAVQPIGDADGNGVPEVAVLSSRNSDGRVLVDVKNAFGATNPNPIWYSSGFTAQGLTILIDADQNGIEESGVLLIRNSDGRILVEGRNASGGTAPNSYWFAQ